MRSIFIFLQSRILLDNNASLSEPDYVHIFFPTKNIRNFLLQNFPIISKFFRWVKIGEFKPYRPLWNHFLFSKSKLTLNG